MRKVFILLLSFGLCISCLNPDCNKLAEYDKKKECLLIIKRIPVFDTRYLNAEGEHLKTGEFCKCRDDDNWWVQYRDYMSVGDTLIKRKGELVFYIHKKDTILSFPWKCEGKIYE
jgi:hypothetical protein